MLDQLKTPDPFVCKYSEALPPFAGSVNVVDAEPAAAMISL
jgi:hypothetical protein